MADLINKTSESSKCITYSNLKLNTDLNSIIIYWNVYLTLVFIENVYIPDAVNNTKDIVVFIFSVNTPLTFKIKNGVKMLKRKFIKMYDFILKDALSA